MDIFFTSKNTGPSHSADPKYLKYVGTDLDKAIEAVGDFQRYERPVNEASKYMHVLPQTQEVEFVKYYMADGWWYSIVKVTF